MYEELLDDRMAGEYPDAVAPVEMPRDLQEAPSATPPDPGMVPDWPPEVVPVAFWPEDVLRRALQDAPGARLARVVAEALDVDGNLEIGMPVAADPDSDSDSDSDSRARARVLVRPGAVVLQVVRAVPWVSVCWLTCRTRPWPTWSSRVAGCSPG